MATTIKRKYLTLTLPEVIFNSMKTKDYIPLTEDHLFKCYVGTMSFWSIEEETWLARKDKEVEYRVISINEYREIQFKVKGCRNAHETCSITSLINCGMLIEKTAADAITKRKAAK